LIRGEGDNALIIKDSITNDEVLDFVIDQNKESTRYYAARNKGVFKSINYGRTWRRVLTVDSTLNEMIKISQPSNDGTVLFKVDRKLFLGNNNSNAVRSINFPDNYAFGSDVGYRNPFGGRRGDWDNAVAIDPDNSKKLFVGMDKLGFSNDMDNSWYNIYPGHEDLHDIKFVNNDILVANDGGVFKLNKGIDYSFKNSKGELTRPTSLNTGLNTYQFYRVAINGNTAVGNADHNGIKFTENLNSENPNWKDVYSSGYGNNGLENDFVYKDIKNPNRYFVQFQAMNLLRLNIPYSAQNQGNDLFVFHNPNTDLNPYMRIQGGALNQQFNNLNYPIGTIAQDPRSSSNTMLIASHNSGNNTVNYSTNFSIKISRNSNLNPTGTTVNNCGDRNSRTFCYDQIGINNQTFPTWTESYNNGNTPIVSIAYSPDKNGKVYALDEFGKFLMNTDVDNTSNWEVKVNISLNTSETMRQLIVNQNNTSSLFAISHQRIFKSTNEGETWSALNFSLPATNKINSITQHHKNFETYFVATDRGVYYTKNSGDSWSKFGEQLPNAPIMQVFTEGKYLYAVSFGRGLWRVDLVSGNSLK